MNMEGEPSVIEYNCRMGDPETEAVVPRIKSDLLGLFKAVTNGTLSQAECEIDERVVAAVMLVSGGYPGDYEKGKKISGLESVRGSIAFHAGTIADGDNVLSNGGRVIAVSSYGSTMQEALSASFENAAKIRFDKMYYRKDIGKDLLSYTSDTVLP
jgi:phosphoribosylamine--glycine ligase